MLVWHTVFDSRVLCAKDFSFFFSSLKGVAHKLQFWHFVCHGFFIFLLNCERCGTRTSILAFCVPRISHFSFQKEKVWHTNFDSGILCAKYFSFFLLKRIEDSACMAHDSSFHQFVCQNCPPSKRETAPPWHTIRLFINLCAKIARLQNERQRLPGTRFAI